MFFDMDGDGRNELTGWVGKDDGLLAIDENANGNIDSVHELIGDLSRSGFTELLTYDLNGDKVIDSRDAVYAKLKVWTDADGDGETDAGELVSLATAGIRSIDLNFTTVNFTAEGNRIHEQSTFARADGSVGTVAEAWFDVDNVITARDPTTTGKPTVDALPDVPGYGDVASLRTAMAADGALTSLVANVVNRPLDSLVGVRDTVEAILFRWTGSTAVDPASRGPNVDARELAALEKMLGTPFGTEANPNPTPAAAPSLLAAWNSLVDGLMTRLLLSGPMGELMDNAVYASSIDRVISVQTPDEIMADLIAGVPAGTTLQVANYWAAALPAARTIATEQGVDLAGAEWTAAESAALAPHGLAPFANLLVSGVAAVAGAATDLDANGVFRLDDAASTLYLNGSRQAVYAGGGADRLTVMQFSSSNRYLLDGGDGDDRLQGGSGADWLDGGAGRDVMAGGQGDDTYTIDGASDIVVEAANAGVDTIRSSVALTLAASLENLVLLGSGALAGTGNGGENRITGNAGANTLRGLAGDDRLDGGLGADVMYGGLGDDVYVVDSAADRVVEEGTDDRYDIVYSSVSYVLPKLAEQIVLSGTAAIDAVGNDLANVLVGNAAANVLNGRGGDDDMRGGGGNDKYYVDSVYDDVIEAADEGADTVYASSSFALDANVENLTLLGDGGFEAIGNGLANILTGNAGNNWLDGGAGADRMIGGAGDDTYTVDVTGDSVTELANGGADSVRSILASTVLGANVENLQLFHDYIDGAARSGTGNALANLIKGTNGANTLKGLDGDDRLYGYDGVDILEGGAGADLINGGEDGENDTMIGGLGDDIYVVDSASDVVTEAANAGVDTVVATVSAVLAANVENLELADYDDFNGTGNALANRLTGNRYDNTLDGLGGADTMIGREGDDTYVVDNAGDTVTEVSGQGLDTVQTALGYTLGAFVENLTLLGNAAVAGTGNSAGNVLIGNGAANVLRGLAGNDWLDGGGGGDTLYGGLGNDIYIVDAAGDRVVEEGTDSSDEIRSSVSFTLPALVERLVLTGTAAINATGNDLDNAIYGNDSANVIDGRGGRDRMYGGGGNDIYHVDDSYDYVYEDADEGIDLVYASAGFTLSGNIEKLTLTGLADIYGVGNSIANIITGNAGDNWIDGRSGIDQMAGGLGDDTYTVDVAGDVVTEAANAGVDRVRTALATYTLGANVEDLQLYLDSFDSVARSGTGNALANVIEGTDGVNALLGLAGDDTLYGYGGVDRLEGGDGADLLNGGAGDDVMVGGAGDDRYVVGAAGDRVIETANGGTDTVASSVSFILTAEIENLELTGTAAIDGQGNALANRLTGNAAANGLNGGAGADVMEGGAGNDTYTVDDVGDVVIEAPGAGLDTVRSSISYTADIAIENITLLNAANITATGNELDNVIVGNAGVNVITGGRGADVMSGGARGDRFVWTSIRETGVTTDTVDQVLDFDSVSGDRLDFRLIDAKSSTATNDAFLLIASDAAFTAEGQIRAYQNSGNTWIAFNTDADAQAEGYVMLAGLQSFDTASMLL